ncbi:hypothetical protein ACILE2_08575 [Capnocytophaga canimorsus]|uniref:hypothetical protein n=1 Tax=Capnocytophaga canimorsus TaxID=28188 RepID=UPI0037CD3CBA
MKRIFILLLFLGCFFNCWGQENGISLGDKVQTPLFNSGFSGILVNSSQFLPKRVKTIGDVFYTFATDEEDKVVFVSVSDEKFKIEGEKWIGKKVSELSKEYLIKKMPGWGFYVKINDTWRGLLSTKASNANDTYTDQDTIISVFQSVWAN